MKASYYCTKTLTLLTFIIYENATAVCSSCKTLFLSFIPQDCRYKIAMLVTELTRQIYELEKSSPSPSPFYGKEQAYFMNFIRFEFLSEYLSLLNNHSSCIIASLVPSNWLKMVISGYHAFKGQFVIKK